MENSSLLTEKPKPGEELESLFHRVLDSKTFRAAPAMRGLLAYLWEHRSEPLNEYEIGVDALERPPNFDPQTDASVRVQIGRLRGKLKEFQEEQVEPFPLRLSIPLGGHDLEWTYDAGQSQPEPLRPAVTPSFPSASGRNRAVVAGLAVTAVALAILCVVMFFQIRNLEASLPAPASPPRFLRSFFANGKPPMIVLPTPAFFHWPAAPDLVVRDRTVAEFKDWPNSDFMRNAAKQWGTPTIFPSYVNVQLVAAGLNLSHFLTGVGQRPDVTAFINLAAESVDSHNLVFMGAPRDYSTDDRVREILRKTNFQLSFLMPSVVTNRNPRAGEAAAYRDADLSTTHREYYNLIVLLPPMRNGVRMLLLLGHAPQAYVTPLVVPEAMDLMDKQWREGGSPDAWEMMIQTEMTGDTVRRVTPKAFRPIDSKFWE